MNTQSNTDVMQLCVIAAASIFGQSMAEIIGPYILIVFASATGAGWSLGRRDPAGKVNTMLYFIRIVLTAVLLTVAITKVVAGFVPQIEENGFIAPVAFIIGAIGDDWHRVGDWIISIGKRLIIRHIGKE